jgi:hypothetical protein
MEFHFKTIPLGPQAIVLGRRTLKSVCRGRDLSSILPNSPELKQTALNMSSSGDPLEKHLASQNLKARAALSWDAPSIL